MLVSDFNPSDDILNLAGVAYLAKCCQWCTLRSSFPVFGDFRSCFSESFKVSHEFFFLVLWDHAFHPMMLMFSLLINIFNHLKMFAFPIFASQLSSNSVPQSVASDTS